MNRPLLEIGYELASIMDMIDDFDGDELTPGIEALLDRWFAELGPALDAKLDGYVAVIRTHELRAIIRKTEAERLGKLVSSDENVARRLKDRLKLFLQMVKKRRIDTDRYRISLRENGGLAPLHIDESARLPNEYLVTEVRPDKTGIREAIRSGVKIPGCKLLDRGQHIRID